jgi:hypothetical protein
MPSTEAISERGQRAREIYDRLRPTIETPERIGQMIIIDPESGDYEIGVNEIEASRRLQQRCPGARLYGLRIGYKVAVSFGGVMERLPE